MEMDKLDMSGMDIQWIYLFWWETYQTERGVLDCHVWFPEGNLNNELGNYSD